MSPSNGSPIRLDEVDSAFPLLVQDVSSRVGGSGGDVSTNVGKLAADTIAEALGWRRPPGDDATCARGFVAALSASFELSEFQGHVVSRYTPRGLAIQANMGALTGAQASFYSRANAALTQMLSLLDALTPLAPSYDQEDVDAFRAVVRDGLTTLVAEFGIPGGPRIAKVDVLFKMMTGVAVDTAPPQIAARSVTGQLGQLRDRFGLVREHVNSLDHEAELTTFVTLVDVLGSLQTSWHLQRSQFLPASHHETYLGPDLVLLSRDLAAARESIDELIFRLESVFVGRAERQTIWIGHGSHTMTVEDLVEWVRDFVVVQGPALVRQGRDGIESSFTPIIDALVDAVGGAVDELANPPASWPSGMRSQRVVFGFEQLGGYLDQVAKRARRIRRSPIRVFSVSPDVLDAAGAAQSGRAVRSRVAVQGEGFESGFRIQLITRAYAGALSKAAAITRQAGWMVWTPATGTSLSADGSTLTASFELTPDVNVGVAGTEYGVQPWYVRVVDATGGAHDFTEVMVNVVAEPPDDRMIASPVVDDRK
jgi:hypothetical protein